MPIRIVTDTLCDVPKEFIEQYDICVMPLTVHFGDEAYRDGIDITIETFYEKLAACEELPKTSQVTPALFKGVFEEELQKGNQVIVINGSSLLSGTYSAAVLAKNMVASENIFVIDSKSITLGAGLLVIKAARLASSGVSAEEIVKTIEESKDKMKHFLLLDTLKYLHKGGRLSLSAAIIGSLLNIKPVITMNNGALELIIKARGLKKAITQVRDLINENGWNLNGKIVGINHTIAPENAAMLEEIIMKDFKPAEIIRGIAGSVIATHGGPGAAAIYFEM